MNGTGSAILGALAALLSRGSISPTMMAWFGKGLIGGYTTFSSFSLQTLNLAGEGEWLKAGGNILGSVALCLLGVWLGHLLAESLNR